MVGLVRKVESLRNIALKMYNIINVPDAYDVSEQLGTKFKFGFVNEFQERFFFKEGRENTGENWAEKVCCELAEVIGLPHAQYDLAEWRKRAGVVTPLFVTEKERLILGNEILTPNIKRTQYRTKHHLVRKVTTFLKQEEIEPPHSFINEKSLNALDVFTGYLMFDTLVGNTDRHDENWGLILSERGLELAPTYDHASSLGREISDDVRHERLHTRDKNRSLQAYSYRANSTLYNSPDDTKPLTTIEAFLKSGEAAVRGKDFWLEKLSKITDTSINDILTRIPYDIMSNEAKDFANQLLLFNKKRLQESGS